MKKAGKPKNALLTQIIGDNDTQFHTYSRHQYIIYFSSIMTSFYGQYSGKFRQ